MLAADHKSSRGTSPVAGADLPIAWKRIAGPVEPFLEAVAKRLAGQVDAFVPEIAPHAAYALSSQGKQLRPVLVGLAGKSLAEINDDHVTVAVIIEMVHLATLVHDDVLDEARVRRGRPTMATKWGNDISVLLGDCLFAHALKLAAGFPTTDVCRAVSSATNAVCAGEILQTQQKRNFQLSQAQYYRMLGMKTGELFALACEMGAFLSAGTPAQCAALRQYGMALGTAYQIYDDCVDLFATEVAAGKSLGTDLVKGKLTLPVLLLLERLGLEERFAVQKMIEHWGPAHFPELLNLLKQHQALAASQKVVQEYLQRACDSLAVLPQSKDLPALINLTEFLACQTAALTDGGPAA